MGDRSDDAWLKSDFFRLCYHKFLNWLIVDALIILCLVAIVIGLLIRQQTPPYYASTLVGQILPLTPRGG